MTFGRLKWIGIILCSLFISLYIARKPLVTALANHYLATQKIQLGCLDWSINSWRSVQIQTLCLKHEAFVIEAEDVNLNQTHAAIKKVTVSLKQNQTQTQTQSQATPEYEPLSLSLPNRPLLNIASLEVASNDFVPAIKVSINEHELNRFEVQGDVQGSLQLAPTVIDADVDLMSPVIRSYIPELIKNVSGRAEVSYRGNAINVALKHQLSGSVKHESCLVQLHSSGVGQFAIDLNTQQVNADLSGLNNTLDVDDCDSFIPHSYAEQLRPLLVQPWQLQFPSVAKINSMKMLTEQVILVSEDKSSQLNIKVLTADLAVNKADADFQLIHQSTSLGELSFNGSMAFVNKQINGNGSFSYHSDVLPLVPFQGQDMQIAGNVQVDFQAGQTRLKLDAIGALDNVDFEGFSAKQSRMTINSNIEFSKYLATNTQLHLTVPELKNQKLNTKNNQLQLDLSIDTSQMLQLNGLLSSDLIESNSIKVKGTKTQFSLAGGIGAGEIFTQIEGETQLAAVQTSDLTLKNITIESSGQQSRGVMFTHFVEGPGIEGVFKHQYSPLAHPYQLLVTAKPIIDLQSIMDNFVPELKLAQGEASIEASGDLNLQTADFIAQLHNVSALYGTHYIDDITTVINGQFSSGTINIAPSKVNIAQVRSGVVLSDVSAALNVKDNQAFLSDINAQVFDGQVNIPRVNLSAGEQHLQLNAHSLDLALLAQAGRDAGIELMGRISGVFPVTIKDKKVTVERGKLFNADTGKLKVAKNASIEALKAQQPSLKSVIGVLDDLTIDSLNSDVALTEDGWLTLAVQIEGENKPQSQPVNFNYTHQENIFTLFRALRLSDEITQKVEDALTKQEQSP